MWGTQHTSHRKWQHTQEAINRLLPHLSDSAMYSCGYWCAVTKCTWDTLWPRLHIHLSNTALLHLKAEESTNMYVIYIHIYRGDFSPTLATYSNCMVIFRLHNTSAETLTLSVWPWDYHVYNWMLHIFWGYVHALNSDTVHTHTYILHTSTYITVATSQNTYIHHAMFPSRWTWHDAQPSWTTGHTGDRHVLGWGHTN